jgi:di/tricarboxylate transporter
MTFEQAAVFAILGALIVLLVWDRVRYDLVAGLALLAAVIVGVVPAKEAFRGFSDDIVVIVGSALIVSAAVARSGLVQRLMRPLTPRMKSTEVQIAVLATVVALLSAFMKNIGALAMFMPIAVQLARRSGTSPSRLLMPLSFSALLGGLMTLIGTSPNIIVSRLRQEILGEPFRMFDFMPVGIWLAVAGVVFLVFGWRLLPRSRKAAAGEDLFSVADYLTEVRLKENSPLVGKLVADLEELAEGQVTVVAIIRDNHRRYTPEPFWELFPGDVLVLESDAQALESLMSDAGLELVHDQKLTEDAEKRPELSIVEAVVAPGSPIIGRTVEEIGLRKRYGVNLLAHRRHGRATAQRLRGIRFAVGDLLVLRIPSGDIADRLAMLGVLPLAERNLQLRDRRRMWLPALILVGAMALAGTGTVPVAMAFFGAALAVMLVGALTLNEAYSAVDWPVIVLLGALIPVSDSLRATGGTELIAQWLSMAASALPAYGSLALVLVAAMAVTPFLNNAATVLVMAPIGAGLATKLGLNPDPFLMAVAVGAACDFLTPIGHQCNTLVMGPGGYRFGDYWRLGLPLSVLVAVLGTALIGYYWPLT